MNGQRWPLSQEANKSKGTCSVCFETRQLHLRGNTIHLHGPRSAPCHGSNKPPLSPRFASQLVPPPSRSPAPQLVFAGSSHSSTTFASGPTIGTTAIGTDASITQSHGHRLTAVSHPALKCPIIKHIPKSVRPACCTALLEILSNIQRNTADDSAWVKLFEFCPSILCVPTKSGSNTSVSSIIRARLTGCCNSPMAGSHHAIPRRKSDESAIAAAVSSKVEDGNLKAALRLICSEDKPADCSDAVFNALLSKHPPRASNRQPVPDPVQGDFASLQVSESSVLKALKSFPAGSSGGPDGLRPQHLIDLVSCKMGGPALLSALTGFVNLVLDGDCPVNVRPILFGARLIAIVKKSGGIRPIAVGYTVRRLVAKCANNFAQEQLATYFRPLQLGVAVAGGCEAAVHATRRFISQMANGQAVVKLDFSNAFNSLRRDAMLDTVSNRLPQLYKFCWTSYNGDSILQIGDKSIISAEGVQQGDPIGPLLFCLTLHPLLSSLSSDVRIGYLDDVTLGGDLSVLSRDVASVSSQGAAIGLCLNTTKCEVICSSKCPPGLIISDFAHILPSDAMLLGAPVLRESALDKALSDRCTELLIGQSRLSLITAHDALLLLKASVGMPKLTYILRASPCSGHPTLSSIDDLFRSCVSRITNTDLSESQWLQACLPVKKGGLGVRLANHLAPSAYLSAAHATRDLQSSILDDLVNPTEWDDAALKAWSDLSNAAEVPSGLATFKQREWDRAVVEFQYSCLLQSHGSDGARARLLAVSAPHSGDWLNAMPISSCGLRLDDEAIRVAVGLRLGTRLCAPHTCVCSAPVDPNGTHGLSCKKDSARILRHNALNDIIHRSLLRASVPAVKEPPGLLLSDGKRPDGATQIPWSSGKCLTWDVTVTDTLAPSYVTLSATSACNAAERAASNKVAKYACLAATHEFVPVAIETLGPINASGRALLTTIGRRLSQVTDDPRETSFLFQRISICLQRYNSLSLRSTFGDITSNDPDL